LSRSRFAGDRAKTERLTRVFQDRVAAAIEASLSAAAEDGKVRRRILQQIVTPRAGEELAALKCALKGRDVLASLSARLPLQIEDLSSDQLDGCKALIDSAAARDGELYLYALLTVMNLMTAPWQLIRLAFDPKARTELALPVDSTRGRALAAQGRRFSICFGPKLNQCPAACGDCCGHDHRERSGQIRCWIQMKLLK
jgi:hypothetical protein